MNLLGGSPSRKEIDLFSVEKQINADYPPTFLWCGGADRTVDPKNSRQLAQVLQQNGVPFLFKEYPGVDHGVGLGTGLVCEPWFDNAVEFWRGQREENR